MDAMELLLGRRSAAQLSGPAPGNDVLEKILSAAVRAPDHGRLRPWRFVVIRTDMLDRFGDVLAEALKRKQPGATVELLQREREKARRAPLIIVASCRARKDSKIPEIEQFSSAVAAAQNIMLAAHALGYGAMWKTGDAAYDDEAKRALGLDSADAIVGFIYLGIRTDPSKPLPTRPAPEAREFVTEWKA